MARISVWSWIIFVAAVLSTCSCKLVSASRSNDSSDGDKDDLKPIYFAFMTAFSGSFVSSGTIPAVNLAIERVNSNMTLLQGYRLNYTTVYDTQVSQSLVLHAL